MVRLTDRPNMTLDVYHGCKTTIQFSGSEDVQAIEVLLHSSYTTVCLHVGGDNPQA